MVRCLQAASHSPHDSTRSGLPNAARRSSIRPTARAHLAKEDELALPFRLALEKISQDLSGRPHTSVQTIHARPAARLRPSCGPGDEILAIPTACTQQCSQHSAPPRTSSTEHGRPDSLIAAAASGGWSRPPGASGGWRDPRAHGACANNLLGLGLVEERGDRRRRVPALETLLEALLEVCDAWVGHGVAAQGALGALPASGVRHFALRPARVHTPLVPEQQHVPRAPRRHGQRLPDARGERSSSRAPSGTAGAVRLSPTPLSLPAFVRCPPKVGRRLFLSRIREIGSCVCLPLPLSDRWYFGTSHTRPCSPIFVSSSRWWGRGSCCAVVAAAAAAAAAAATATAACAPFFLLLLLLLPPPPFGAGGMCASPRPQRPRSAGAQRARGRRRHRCARPRARASGSAPARGPAA